MYVKFDKANTQLEDMDALVCKLNACLEDAKDYTAK